MQSRGRTSGRVVAWLVVALAVGILAAIVCGFMIQWKSVRAVGGKWKHVLAKPMLSPEPGHSWARLYRATAGGSVCVAANVWAPPVYYGDDCAGYEISLRGGESRRYFLACADREPLLAVTASPYGKWLLTSEGIVPAPGTPEESAGSKILTTETLKSRAMAEPPRTRSGCE